VRLLEREMESRARFALSRAVRTFDESSESPSWMMSAIILLLLAHNFLERGAEEDFLDWHLAIHPPQRHA
jgi:hypothetical protein